MRRHRAAAIFAALILVAIWGSCRADRSDRGTSATRPDHDQEIATAPSPRALSPTTNVPAPSPEISSNGDLSSIGEDDERREVRKTIDLIDKGGPFPHRKDGSIFRNSEKRLPLNERGYYREYTVRTEGSSDRGARRVVTGRGGELYYTRDHYRTFVQIRGTIKRPSSP